jgi:AcrR family transcriptional regulator
MSLRERKKQQVRDDILAAASKLITRHGYQATNMRAIADDANISHQTLYNYFPTKADLVKALLSKDVARIIGPLSALLDESHPDLPSLFKAAVSMIFTVIDQNDRSLWREVTAVSMRQPGEFMPLYDEYYEGAQQRIGAAIVDARQRGDLVETLDTELLAQTIYSIVDHAGLIFIMRPEMTVADIVAHVDAQLELLIRPYIRHPD